jgi:type VI secretion system protein ImpE
MTSSELVRGGRLTDGLAALQSEIRQKPADQSLRLFLFQLDCVLGRLDKALTQLQLVASLDAETMLLAQVLRQVVACEMLRREVFAGKRTPLIFGEPQEWLGLLVQANTLVAERRFAAAAELRVRAFEAAPATPGTIDDRPFEWIADADSRLGPVLEAIVDGKYYWVPFCRVAKVQVAKPTDLRDTVWTPAHFHWSNGGDAAGFIPARYPETENCDDDALRLARKTIWTEHEHGCFVGLGQRMLSTDAGEYALLDCRTINLTSAPSSETGTHV